MKKTAYLSVALGLLVAGPVYAQSPLPAFDKEAVTEYPYNRRGEQQVITKDPTLDKDSRKALKLHSICRT